MAELRDSYKSGLYLFGILKVKKGAKLEKVFWAISMLMIVSFTFYMVYRNAKRYTAYDVRTKILSEEVPERVLPIIIFCLESAFLSNVNCYNNKSLHPSLESCNKTASKGIKMLVENGYFSNEWIEGGRKLSSNCHVLNDNQTIKLSTDRELQRVYIYPLLDPTDRIVIITQSKEEFQNRKEVIYVSQYAPNWKFYTCSYGMYIQKKHLISMPAPYTTNCTDGDFVSNMFSSRYTYSSCREQCAYDNMYKECGDTIDIWKKYITQSRKLFNNSKYASREDCIREHLNQAILKTIPNCDHCN